MTRTLLATACVALLPLTLHAQSLGAVAKKAGQAKAKQEQAADGKKADAPQTKVYTNKDLADVPPSTAPVAAPEPGGSKTTTTTTSGTATTSPDEQMWRARARELRRALTDDQTKLAAAKAHLDSLPDTAKGAAGAPIVDAWMKARAEISRLTATVDNDQRAVSELEDDARRAGVPPGWLRDK